MGDQDKLNSALLEVSTELSEVRNKQRELYKDKIEIDYEEMVNRKGEEEKAKGIDLSVRDLDRIKKIQEDNIGYLKRAQNCGIFINESFEDSIPYFARNIILCVAQTGDGKSTICANVCAHALKQGLRPLVITNEENVSDVYNRVTCLIKHWSYSNHKDFTAEQIQTFSEFVDLLSHRMVVVDDSYNDSIGQTSTIEGMESILTSLITKKVKFDVIIIDYYQNIDRSIKNSGMKDWEVQGKFAKFLDQFKNAYEAPIILLAQQKQQNGDGDNMSFKESIEGRKAILNVATCAIEVKAERELRMTSWTIKKSRFQETVGEVIKTGYSKGCYVKYDEKFKNNVQMYKESKDEQKMRMELSKRDGLGDIQVTNSNIKKGDQDEKEDT